MNNYKVVGSDTDAVWFGKQDESPFTNLEIERIIQNINKTFPEYIKFDMDGCFSRFIILKAKNYIMYDGNKIKLKGSSLKSSMLEPILKEMLNEFIEALVFDKHQNLVNIYHKYIREAMNIRDIKKWSKKITISTRTTVSERSNETRIIDALNRSNKPITEGDKHHIFFLEEKKLELAENFNGEYHKLTMVAKIFKCTQRFETILPIKEMFLNYSLARNQKLLEELSK